MSHDEHPRAKDALALRPGLADIMDRQERVLKKLDRPIPHKEIVAWKGDVVRAAVGRVSDGLRTLLGDPDMAPLVDYYLTDLHPNKNVAESFRRLLQQSISLEFAHALEDLSRSSHELIPGLGVAGGSMPTRNGGGGFR